MEGEVDYILKGEVDCILKEGSRLYIDGEAVYIHMEGEVDYI